MEAIPVNKSNVYSRVICDVHNSSNNCSFLATDEEIKAGREAEERFPESFIVLEERPNWFYLHFVA